MGDRIGPEHAANLVTYLNNPKYDVESCTVTPFELVAVTDPL